MMPHYSEVMQTIAQTADMTPEQAHDALCKGLSSILSESFNESLRRFSVDAYNHLDRSFAVVVEPKDNTPILDAVNITITATDEAGAVDTIHVIDFNSIAECAMTCAIPAFQLTLIHAFVDLTVAVVDEQGEDTAE